MGNWHLFGTTCILGILEGTDPKISPKLIFTTVDIRKYSDFWQLQNEGVNNLPKRQLFTLNKHDKQRIMSRLR